MGALARGRGRGRGRGGGGRSKLAGAADMGGLVVTEVVAELREQGVK